MQNNYPHVSSGRCRTCGDHRVLVHGYCAACLPESYLQQPAPPLYDRRATEIIERHIARDQKLLGTVRAIITHAYLDAELAEQEDLDAITAPRADAAEALRELFDKYNPLYTQQGVYFTLLDFALDRCNFGEIVDHQRRRMEEMEGIEENAAEGTRRANSCRPSRE